MDKETYKALKILINHLRTGATDTEGVFDNEITQVENWMNKTAKQKIKYDNTEWEGNEYILYYKGKNLNL